ncbi:MAG: hypothetical protein M3066_07965 [Actinomycetota bacterium]|nr:hypothetical protein [Actinomycetota bacterium]
MTVVVDIDVDGGTVLTTATDVVGPTVDRTVTTGAATAVELGPGWTEEVVVSGGSGDGATVAVVLGASPANRTWAPHAVAARQIPRSSDRVVLPKA